MIYGFRKIRVSQNIQVIGPILGLKPLWLTTPACSRLFSTSSCCRASRSVSNCAVSSVSCAVLLSIFAWCSPTTGDQMVPKCGKDQGHKPSGDAVYHHIYGDFGVWLSLHEFTTLGEGKIWRKGWLLPSISWGFPVGFPYIDQFCNIL